MKYPLSFLPPSHTRPSSHTQEFSFDVSVRTRTEGDKTQPLIKRQRHSGKLSQIWSKASLGSCHFMEDGGQNTRLPPACGLVLTNPIWQSPSLLLRLFSCFTSPPLPLLCSVYSSLLCALSWGGVERTETGLLSRRLCLTLGGGEGEERIRSVRVGHSLWTFIIISLGWSII